MMMCLAQGVAHPVQVLSDVDKRKIYDVYGRLGLQAGMELGSKHKSIEELRAEWQKFQDQQQERRVATEIAPKTHITAKCTAVPLISSINFESGTCCIPLIWAKLYYEPVWPALTAGAVYHVCSFRFSDKFDLAMAGASSNPSTCKNCAVACKCASLRCDAGLCESAV